MRRDRVRLFALAGALLAAGCHSPGLARSRPPVAEPGLEGSVSPGRPVTFVDRHPLFSKPRDYYETADGGKVTKTARSTFIGVPAGIYGELKQIVVGKPPGV